MKFHKVAMRSKYACSICGRRVPTYDLDVTTDDERRRLPLFQMSDVCKECIKEYQIALKEFVRKEC